MPMETYKRSYDYGAGKENYAAVAKAFDEAYGDPYVGMNQWWRTPQQWIQFRQLRAKAAVGRPALIREFGKDHELWDSEPASIPLFGEFTGSQHEFGGNEFLAAAAQLAGMTPDDLGQWLLWADYKRNPSLYV